MKAVYCGLYHVLVRILIIPGLVKAVGDLLSGAVSALC